MNQLIGLFCLFMVAVSTSSQNVTELWNVVDGCLTEANLTRSTVDGLSEVSYSQRQTECRFSNKALNCLLSNLNDCLNPMGPANPVFEYIINFIRECGLSTLPTNPGSCPPSGSGCDHNQTCSSGSDYECSKMYKCCDNVCKRALPAQPGCDIYEAMQCMERIMYNAVYLNNQQFCSQYVTPMQTCLNDNLASCNNETRATSAQIGYQLNNAVIGCNSDICEGGNKCGPNGECVSLLDRPFSQEVGQGEDGNLLDAVVQRFDSAYYCKCHPPYEGDSCSDFECESFNVIIDEAALSRFQGLYELENGMFKSKTTSELMTFDNRTRTFLSSALSDLLKTTQNQDGTEVVTFVEASLGLNQTLGQSVSFTGTTCQAGTVLLWPIVDECLEEVNLTRDYINQEFDLLGFRQQQTLCPKVHSAMNCILANFSQCFDPFRPAYTKVTRFLSDMRSQACRAFQNPGYCPKMKPDCSGTAAENQTSECFDRGQGLLKRGITSCPYLYKCCNGTCQRADPPSPGCDIEAANMCRQQLLANAVYFNRSHFCQVHVNEYHRCFTSNIESCDNETLNEFDSSIGWESRRLTFAIAACDFDPCQVNPCGANGTCVDLTFPPPSTGQDDGNIFDTISREQQQSNRAYSCDCDWPYEGSNCDELDCKTYRVSPFLTELKFLSGKYEVKETPNGRLGYVARNGRYYADRTGQKEITVYAGNGSVLLTINITDGSRILSATPSLGIDQLVGKQAGFDNSSCLDGKEYLYDYGEFAGDRQVATNNLATTGYTLSPSIRIGSNNYNRICIYIHGFVAFANGACPPVSEAQFTNFPPMNKPIPQFSAFGGLQEIAPSSNGKIFYNAHFSGANVLRATRDIHTQNISGNFVAKVVYVITYDRISPSLAVQPSGISPTNTYQIILVTDFRRTFVMTRHDKDLMKAAEEAYFTSTQVDLHLGYVYDNHTYQISEEFPYFPDNDTGLYIVNGGNASDERGPFWFEDITNYDEAVTLSPCQNWIGNNASEQLDYKPCQADQCPPSEIFAIVSGLQCIRNDPKFNERTCYTLWNWITNGTRSFDRDSIMGRSICCYTKSNLACSNDGVANLILQRNQVLSRAGSLITTPKLAGYTQMLSAEPVTFSYTYTYRNVTYSRTYTYFRWITDDNNGWDICCNQGSGSDCQLFYRIRRVARSQCFTPRILAFLRGDPHITTLDGKTYTFNGRGEYVLLKSMSGNFELQARTARVTSTVNGQTEMGNATKFSGIAIYLDGSDVIQVELDDPTSENAIMVVFANGSVVDASTNPSFGATTVTQNSASSLTITLVGGYVIDVQVSRGVMVFVVSVPSSDTATMKGLLGTPNNDTSDDFTRPDGTTISIDSTMEEIFHEFGEKWRTSSSSSKFTYQNGETWDTYNDLNWVPSFDETVDAAAVTACGDDAMCAFDFKQTGNQEIAQDTATANQNFFNDTVVLKNNAPTLTIENDGILTLEPGQSGTITVNLFDADEDAVQLHPAEGYNTSCVTINGNDVTIDGTDLIGCDIALIGLDSNNVGSEVVRVTVVQCPACVNGQCNPDMDEAQGDIYLKNASCTCNTGWTGETCEEDVDGCASAPCGNMTCVDLTPQEQTQNNSQSYRCEDETSPTPSGNVETSTSEVTVNQSVTESPAMSSDTTTGTSPTSATSDITAGTASRSAPNVQPSSSATQPDSSDTVTDTQGTEPPVTTGSPADISQEVWLEVSFNVSSSRCQITNWKGKVKEKLTSVHKAKTTRIDKCSAGSAVILYAIQHTTAVTDEDRAARVTELLAAIEPATNSLTVNGEPLVINGNPVLLLNGGNTRVEAVDSCSYYTEQHLCLNGGSCKVSDGSPVCRCSRSWQGTFCHTAGESDDNKTVLIIALSVAGSIALISLLVVVGHMMKQRSDKFRQYEENHRRASGRRFSKASYQDWYRGPSPQVTWMRHQIHGGSNYGYAQAGYLVNGYQGYTTYGRPAQLSYPSNTTYGRPTQPRRPAVYGQPMRSSTSGYYGYRSTGRGYY